MDNFETNPAKVVRSALIELGYEEVDNDIYVKGDNSIELDDAVELYKHFTIKEYDRGYDRALTHIIGLCSKELGD